MLSRPATTTYACWPRPHGKRRFANARKLMRMAADYEDLEGPDLRGFVTLIGSLGDMGDDEGNAPSLAEGEDVVRVMTVHQAKGLEFPVVVLAGLCSDPPGYKAGEIMVGSDGRMAARIMVPSNSPDRPGWGPVEAIIEEQKRRKAEEDVRVLYVAMTRARDQAHPGRVAFLRRQARDLPYRKDRHRSGPGDPSSPRSERVAGRHPRDRHGGGAGACG